MNTLWPFAMPRSQSPRPGKPVCWVRISSGPVWEIRCGDRPGGRGLCLRRNRPALIVSIEAGPEEPGSKQIHTSAQGLWESDEHQQCGDLGQCAPHYPAGESVVFFHRNPREQGNQDFFPGGKVKNTGRVEVPMGITLREIIYDIGGGPQKRKRDQRAVADGGAFGRVYPRVLLPPSGRLREPDPGRVHDGLGGADRHDEGTCMVDVANTSSIPWKEDPGQMPPCREG